MARLQKSREKILETAERLFSQDGYDATSVHEICMTAGVSKGAFYHYFSTKENLFLALMETWLDRMGKTLAGSDTAQMAFPENMLLMADHSVELFRTIERHFSVMIEFWKEAIKDPIIWERSVRPQQELLSKLKSQVAVAQQTNAVRRDVDALAAAHLLLACALGYLLQAALNPEHPDWTALARNGFELVVNELRS
ncbi:MAG: TetR/AcrR family transcriptional regulator [Chloroflexi bacterium]|jgi:AcrR family transcriptional regulator|nr:TetR/AcrR family transcriptional regulator [Chloroflexota bacterium]